MSIACEQEEIEFTSLAKQLAIEEEDIEDFIIQGIIISKQADLFVNAGSDFCSLQLMWTCSLCPKN